MFAVGKIRKGAQRAYDLAPNPATFYTLVRAANATTIELKARWQALPLAVQNVTGSWRSDADKYAVRLQGYLGAATDIVDAVKSGSIDWQKALRAGSNYARALQAFFSADSAYWASLANRLEAVEPEPDLLSWWNDTFHPEIGAALDSLAGSGAGELADETQKAVDKTLADPRQFLQTGFSLGLAALAVAGLWFAWPLIAPSIRGSRAQ